MKSKHYLFSTILSLWGLCFLGATQTNMENILPLLNTTWFDAFTALFIGAIIGIALTFPPIRQYVDNQPFCTIVTGVAPGVIGLGAIGIGVTGALIVYMKTGDVALIRIPLHASVIGLALFTWYCVLRWRHSCPLRG